jgi:hypothetical protein
VHEGKKCEFFFVKSKKSSDIDVLFSRLVVCVKLLGKFSILL